jgi:CubicO group peptidase (beta-lactamase class C family)
MGSIVKSSLVIPIPSSAAAWESNLIIPSEVFEPRNMKVNSQPSCNKILCLILSLIIAFSNSPGFAQQKQIDFAGLDKVAMEELKQRNTPGGAVAVIKDGQVIYAKGYGLMSYNYRGVRVTQHGGASTGYGSTIQLVPEHKFAVIVLTNRSGETLPHTQDKAMELLLPLKPPERDEMNSAPPPSEAEMAGYAGRYSHAPQTWEVFVKGGKL